MLKKMRWRFTGAAMAAFSTVIIILLCFVNVWNYQAVTRQQDETLNRLLEAENGTHPFPGNTPPGGTPEHFSPEVQYMIRFFSVQYDTQGNATRINQDFIASVSEDDAASYAEKALAHGKEHGYQNGYRYLVQHSDDGTLVIFLNSERELQTIRSLLLITAAIAIICLLVVFVLVLIFSRRALRPYVRNMEAQKQFITNASHELKTPLTSISTSADVLAMEYEQDEWVENIQIQTARMSKLISNLVTLSRLDEENPFPEKQEFSLSDAVWEASEPFTATARARGKEYLLDIEDNIMLSGDPAAIQQVISILLDNALKYSSENGTISLSLHRHNKKAEITVSNTCSDDQIPDISKVFERFYRGDPSHSSQIGGSGIGLSIARATVEAHGGQICASYADGKIFFRILL